jgi:hypothetical protein
MKNTRIIAALLAVALAGCANINAANTTIDKIIGDGCKADTSEATKIAGTLDPAGAKCAAAYGEACDILTATPCSGGPLCAVEKLRIGRIEQNSVNAACVGVTVP